jgi:dihydroorotase/N-acyl-D-amino-acid deacylase
MGRACLLVPALILAASAAPLAAAGRPREAVDLLIRGGTVIDGSGSPGRVADIAVRGGRIVSIGRAASVRTKRTIDAAGLIVAPGFIDGHSHTDTSLAQPAGRLNRRVVTQGVTTIVGGPDGEYAPKDVARLLESYSRHGIGTNVALFVGHNGIRREVMGANQDRAPTAAELKAMQELARQGMRMGAVGLSSGLMYTPGLFSKTEEVAAIAAAVAPFRGVYSTHVRDPHRSLIKSDQEAIAIGALARLPVNLTHATTPGRFNRGLVREVVKMVEDARAKGLKVTTDQYPYHAVQTIKLWGVLDYPSGINRTPGDIRAALRNPETGQAIRAETISGGADGFSQYKASGADSLLILSCPGCEQNQNKFVADLAEQRKTDGFTVIRDLLLNEKTDDIVVSLGGFFEEDMQFMMRQPWTMIASDGSGDTADVTGFGAVHPRSSGTFPRILGRYVRELGLITLPEAIRKMTSAPADFLGLKNRGRLRSGSAADIVIFDAGKIADRSTWKSPMEEAVGVLHVFVNGEPVLSNGSITGATPGRFLKKGIAEGQLLRTR